MQRIIYLIAIVSILFIGCEQKKQKETSKVIIEGQVTGYTKTLGLYGMSENRELTLDSEGKFSLESDSLKKGFYDLSFGHENRLSLYLKPGSNLHITVNYNAFLSKDKKAITISGENTKESELLYQLMFTKERSKYNNTEAKDKYLPMLYGKNPEQFTNFLLTEMEKGNQLIQEYSKKYSLDQDFIKHLQLNRKLDYNSVFKLYGHFRKYLKAEELEIPKQFSDYFADQIPQNDFELYEENREYASYVREKYFKEMEAALSSNIRESLAYYKAKIAFLETCDFPQIIVESMYSGLTIGYMRTRDPEVRAYLDSVIYTKVIDKASMKRYEDYKAGEASYKDGDMAPNFTLIDKDGKEVSLSDFKGKMVMMDCWATWCGPCVKGLPKYVALKNKYAGKNIVFLCISTDENEKAWRKKMAKDTKGLFEGIQLNTELNENDMKKKYMVQAIPRYILIGKDGRIIRREAPHPDSKEIIDLIDKNL
nr:TlpA disulfide reductase family protein [uncultured Marinifilum sp.]